MIIKNFQIFNFIIFKNLLFLSFIQNLSGLYPKRYFEGYPYFKFPYFSIVIDDIKLNK